MNSQLHVHVPWQQIDRWLIRLQQQRLQPEIAFQGGDLDSLDLTKLERVSAELQNSGLAVTVHAPFMDLNPGALETIVRQATRQRLEQTLAAATQLKARLVVIHPGYDDWHYDHNPQLWLEQAAPFFRTLLPSCERAEIRIGIENIFESRPDTLVDLVTAINHPLVGHCFDVGHWNLFAEDARMDLWLQPLAGRLYHLHLHDNGGLTDQHLPLGAGNIDFTPLKKFLSQLPERPTMTLEAHSFRDLQRSLKALPISLPGVV